MQISSTQSGITGPSGTNAPAPGLMNSDFETFLKMLTTQLKNQDPLNPLESTDFAVQLATFSNVEQQVRTNDLLAGLSSQMAMLGMGQLAGSVGMDARAQMPAYFDGTNPIEVIPNPAAVADTANLVVRNAQGLEVQRQTIPVSGNVISWHGLDGTGTSLPPGVYSFEVESYSNGALLDTTQAEVYARITEARGESGTTMLAFPGGITAPAQSVIGIRSPVS